MAGLFDPYQLKGVTLRNRIVAAPMCQYMATDGVANDWHMAHYAGLARGGAGLVVVEATSVSPEGRISWADLGLWNDEQAMALKKVADLIKAGGAVAGIQIAHAGRKASANRPWEGDDHMPEDDPKAWETIAPSAVAFGKHLPRVPREMTLDDIRRVQADVVRAAVRARAAGFEWLQLHFAHGYLAQNFFSPLSNKRTDEYGGNAENRARYLLETFRAVRRVWPEDKPLNVRLSVIEYFGDDAAMMEESVQLLKQMKAEGLDFVDVSVGFNTYESKIPWGKDFLVPVAEQILKATGLPGSTAWFLTRDAAEADALIREGKLDLVSYARPFLENPHFPYQLAKDLKLENAAWATLPAPYAHWVSRYR